MIDDVVIFLNSEGKKHFGIITEIFQNNMIVILCILNKKKTERQYHRRLLRLVHRKSEWNYDFPVDQCKEKYSEKENIDEQF